ncbi:MAG: zf-HC2 domain-containing protein [Fimbriimonadaceae bacterium]|nr:zf-HC2 domain-containing protein [Fimbriimonadaceae bacterium]
MSEIDDRAAMAALDCAEGEQPGDAAVVRLRQTLRLLAAFAPQRRGACCGRERLVAYHDGQLGAEEAGRVEAHLASCPCCAADLADLAALTQPPWFEAVVRLAAGAVELVRHSFGQAVRPAPLPARGEATATLQLAAAQDDVDLAVRLLAGSPGGVDVRVQVQRSGAPLERARLQLLRGEALLESRVLSGAEEVVLADLAPGDYALAVTPRAGDELARVRLRIEPEEVR